MSKKRETSQTRSEQSAQRASGEKKINIPVEIFHGKQEHQNLVLAFKRLTELEEQFAKNPTTLEMKEKLFKNLNVKFVQTLTELYNNYHEHYYHFSGIFFILQLIQRPHFVVYFREHLKNLKFKAVKQLQITTDIGLILNFMRYIYLVAGLRLTSHEEILKSITESIKANVAKSNPTIAELAATRDQIESLVPKLKMEFMNAVRICSTQYVKTVIGYCAEYFDSPDHVAKHSPSSARDNAQEGNAPEGNAPEEGKVDADKPKDKITSINFVNHSRNTNLCDVDPVELKAVREDINAHANIIYKMLEEWYQVYQKSPELRTMTYYEMLGFYIETTYYGYGCEPDIQKWANIIETSYKGPLNNDFNMLLTYMRSLNIMGYQSLADKALEEYVWRKKKYDSELEKETSIIQNNNAAHLYIQTASDEKTKKLILARKDDSDYMRYQYARLLASEKEYKKSCELFIELANNVTKPDYKDTLAPVPKAKVVAELCCDLITGQGCNKDMKLAAKIAQTAYSKMDDPTGDLNIIMATLNEKNPEKFKEYCIKAFSAGHEEAIDLAEMYGYDDLVQEMQLQNQSED